jgi:hypothetical protein
MAPQKPTNTRRQQRENERRLFVAVIAFLLIVGSALIGVVYGGWAAATGLICLLAGSGLLLFLWLLLTWLERWANREE